MLPIDIIFGRHGQSEGNKAKRASEEGDNSFFQPEFRSRHSRSFRLTDLGIEQAKISGKWLRENVPMPPDRLRRPAAASRPIPVRRQPPASAEIA